MKRPGGESEFAAFPLKRQFDDYVNREVGVLDVLGCGIAASDALATDMTGYKDRYREWLDSRNDVIAASVEAHFPLPIAGAFRRYRRGASNAAEKLAHLQDAWEACIHLLLGLCVGEVSAREELLEDTGVDRRGLVAQSLRERVDVIQKVLEWGRGVLFMSDRLQPASLGALCELIKVRNTRSHRTAMPLAKAKRLLEAAEALMWPILEDLRFLEDGQVVRPTGRTVGGEYEFETFRGFSADIELEKHALTAGQAKILGGDKFSQQQVFWLQGEELWPLAPFWIPYPDEDRHCAFLAMLKKKGRGKALVYEVSGLSTEFESSEAWQVQALEAAKGIFVTSEVGRG